MRGIKIIGIALLLIASPAFSAGWVTDSVKEVAVIGGNGCITLVTNSIVYKVDLTTDAGRSKFSLALAAKTANKQLSIYENDDALVDGCNTGVTIQPHDIVKLVD